MPYVEGTGFSRLARRAAREHIHDFQPPRFIAFQNLAVIMASVQTRVATAAGRLNATNAHDVDSRQKEKTRSNLM
jgi:hypothetical protein